MRSPLILLAVLSLCACEKGAPSGGPLDGDETGDSPAPTAPRGPTGSPIGSPKMKAPPAKRTPEIRDVSTTVTAGKFEVRARLLLSKVTPDDGVRLALAIASAPGHEAPKGVTISYAWHKTVASLKFHVASGGKTTTLQLAAEPAAAYGYLGGPAGDLHFVSLKETGLAEYETQLAWKQATPGVLGTAGSYTLRIEGEVHQEAGGAPFALEALPFEVVAASDAFKPLSALAPLAAAEAASAGKGKAQMDLNVVEDVAGGRWHRFSFPSEGYDQRFAEVLLMPDGKVEGQYAFDHFTCVATSTPIETPAGPVPIERVREGDLVVGFDVERGEPVETIVRRVTSAMVDGVLDLGGLRVTESHPVFADGEFIPAGRLAVGATLRGLGHTVVRLESITLSEVPTQVFDLSVDWPHNFYAGGILVHNKAAHVPLGPRDDRWNGAFIWASAGPG